MKKYEITAPTRVDLAGGTLDLWPIAPLLGNARTINLAISLFAKVLVEEESSSAFRLEIHAPDGSSISFSTPEGDRTKGHLKFPSAVATSFLKQVKELPKKRVKLTFSTDAPLRSGLGGSSTLCVALSYALFKSCDPGFFKNPEWQWKIMEFCRDVEAAYLWTPTGTQDYLAAIFGGLSCFHFQTGKVSRETYSEKVLTELNARTVVLFSGEMHHSGATNWELYKKLLDSDKSLQKGFQAIQKISDKLHQVLVKPATDWDEVGKLYGEEWKIRKSVFQVMTPRLDEMCEFALNNGAIGVKVCGAASGGSLLCLVDPKKIAGLKEQCEKKQMQVLACEGTKKGVGEI